MKIAVVAALASLFRPIFGLDVFYYSTVDCKPTATLFPGCMNIGFGVCCEAENNNSPFNRPNFHSIVDSVVFDHYPDCGLGTSYSRRSGHACGSVERRTPACARHICIDRFHGRSLTGAKGFDCPHQGSKASTNGTEDIPDDDTTSESVTPNVMVLSGHGFWVNSTTPTDVVDFFWGNYYNGTYPDYNTLPQSILDYEISGFEESQKMKRALAGRDDSCPK